MSDYSTIIANASAFDILWRYPEALRFLEGYCWGNDAAHRRACSDPVGIQLGSLGPWPIPPSERVWYRPGDLIEMVCCGRYWPRPIDDPKRRVERIDLSTLPGRLDEEQPNSALSVTAYTTEAVDRIRPLLERWRAVVEDVPEGWAIPEDSQIGARAAIWPVDRLLEAPDRVFFTIYTG